MHREHLVTRLSAVLHQQQWLMAGGPVHSGDIFIVLAVPGDLLDAQSRILVVPVVRELRQRQAHIGVAGERHHPRPSAWLVSARAYRRPEADVCGFAGSLMYHIGSGAALNVSKMM